VLRPAVNRCLCRGPRHGLQLRPRATLGALPPGQGEVVARCRPVLLFLVVRVVVAEARKQAALLLRQRLGLVVEAYLLEPLLRDLVCAVAVLLHRRAGCGPRAPNVEGAARVY
jgi:hypothetical protein